MMNQADGQAHTLSRLLLRGLALCFVLMSLSAGGAIMVSAAQPTPPRQWDPYGFAACDLPCWAGIVPGKTSFDEIMPLLEEHLRVPYSTSQPAYSNVTYVVFGDETYSLQAQIVLEGRGVRELQLYNLTYLPSDWQHILAELGTPDCVTPRRASRSSFNGIALHWQGENGLVIRSFLPLDRDAMILPDERAVPLLGVARSAMGACEDRLTIPWRGFAPLWRYDHFWHEAINAS